VSDTTLRQLAMLREVPRAPRRISTAELQARLQSQGFGTTLRTIQRDLDNLSSVFPLVSDERERPYGWSWRADASIVDLPAMPPETALTFRLARLFLEPLLPQPAMDHLAPHMERAAEVLEQGASPLADWPEKVRVISRTQRLLEPNIDPAVVRTVYHALLEDRRFEAVYRPRNHPPERREYKVNPLGLVVRDGVIYLVASLWNYADVLQLALHRLEQARPLDEPVTRPPGFDLGQYIAEKHFDYRVADEPVRLEALFDDEVAYHLYETPLSADQELMPQGDGRTHLSATVADTLQLRWWLQGFGRYVEVLGPAGLREEFAAIVRALAQRYES